MVKIDFKTTEEKKEGLKIAAKRLNVTSSYILNKLLDDYLAGDTKIAHRQQISKLIVITLNSANCLPKCKEKETVIGNLEELQCLM